MTTDFNRNGHAITSVLTLTRLLSKLGFSPHPTSDSQVRYQKVLHGASTRTDISVNPLLDVWYDHETKKGGNLLDFAMAYWPHLSAEQAAIKIRELCGCGGSENSATGRRKRKAVKVPFYHIDQIRSLGFNAEIRAYLEQQGIWEAMPPVVQEVYYFVVDEKRKRKDFCAAGWPNENGGWEVSCRHFKGCLGKKGMTFIAGAKDHIILFEHMNDYLIWYGANPRIADSPSILIMNGDEFIQAAASRIRRFERAEVFFGPRYLDEHTLKVLESHLPGRQFYHHREGLCPDL